MIFSKSKNKPLVVEYQDLTIEIPTALTNHREDRYLRERVIGQLEFMSQLAENCRLSNGIDIRTSEHKQYITEMLQTIVKTAEMNYTRDKKSENYKTTDDFDTEYTKIFSKTRTMFLENFKPMIAEGAKIQRAKL